MFRELHSESAHATLYEDDFNKRIRLDDYTGKIDDVLRLVDQATPLWTEKIIVKARPIDVSTFVERGYREEAIVKNYFSGVDMHFVTRYLSAARQTNAKEAEEENIVRMVLSSVAESSSPAKAAVTYAAPGDAAELSELYQKTFPVYPTPVDDPEYVRKTMTDGTLYVYIRENNRIVSAASAEINRKYHNAELTDCATADGAQGKGYMRALLMELEKNLRSQGIMCFYSIARAESFGMNKAFHNLGFIYGGRMTKNCIIYSGLEDMNVWYKG